MKSARIWILSLVFSGFLLLAGISLTEWYFGGWSDQRELDAIGIPRSVKLVFINQGLYKDQAAEILYSRDRFGLRGNFLSPREVELLTVGGSTTNQLYISDGKTWQDVLQRELSSRGKSIVLANAGVDGQSAQGNLANFKYWFPKIPGLRPKYILFYVGINDFYLGDTEDSGLPTFVSDQNRSTTFLSEIRERSVIWNLFRKLAGRIKAEQAGAVHREIKFRNEAWTTETGPLPEPQILERASGVYQRRLKRLAAESKAMGAKPIFVTQPSRHYRFVHGELQGVKREFPFNSVMLNGIGVYQVLQAYNRTLLETCKAEDGICIELNQTDWDDQDFYDFVHMTPTGADKLGRMLASKLAEVL